MLLLPWLNGGQTIKRKLQLHKDIRFIHLQVHGYCIRLHLSKAVFVVFY